VRWTNEVTLNGNHSQLSYYVLKCQIDYSFATKIGLASGQHSDIGSHANIYLYATHNKGKECKEGYKYLCELAGEKPFNSTGIPTGQPPCTKKILDELGTEKHLRADIRKQLRALGYEEKTIRGAFKRLEKTGRIFFSSKNHSLKNCEVWAAK